MGRPKKYDNYDLYAPQRAYFKTEKGKTAVKKYNASDSAREIKREWARKKRGTIVNKRQWFIDNYGNIETALAQLNERERFVIELNFGLSGEKPLTLVAISKKMGRSDTLIGNIKRAALAKLEPLKIKIAENKEQLASKK